MREVKFRAWQSHSSLHRKPGMYDVTSLELYDESGVGEAFLALPGENARSSEYLEDIKLMQYTGFKDKSGVEIYEGDILRLGCSTSEKHYIPAVVEWSVDRAGFTRRLIDKRVVGGCPEREVSPGEMHSWVGMHTCLSRYYAHRHEVIGNIHENPELLTQA